MMKRAWVFLAAAALLCSFLVAGGVFLLSRREVTPPAKPRVALSPCRVEGVEVTVECGTHAVFEDRAAGAGRRLDLKIVRFPARNGSPAPDPLFLIAGGPGAATTGMAPQVATAFSRVWQARDIVLVDLRGTGGSNPLDCTLFPTLESYFADLFPTETITACRDQLASRADLRLYTNPNAVEDLNEVRAALGYGPINLYGASAGTTTAMVYLRSHPESVRTVTLEGVSPLDDNGVISFAHDGQRALDMLFAQCAKNPECRAAHPDLPRQFRTVLARLDREPGQGTILDPRSGKAIALPVSRDAFITGLQFVMFDPESLAHVPALIAEAARGEYNKAAAAVVNGRVMYNLVSIGMHLSVRCAEDGPGLDGAAVASSMGTYAGDAWIRAYRRACTVWPRAQLPAGYHAPVVSDTPALLISGEFDPATPPTLGDKVAQHLSRALHVTVTGASHWSGSAEACVSEMIARFISAGTVAGLDTSCAHPKA